MDLLKAEIAAKKRKAISPNGSEGGEKGKKYVRRGEEERKREEEYREREAEKRAARLERLKEEDRQRTERMQSTSATPEVDSPLVDGKEEAAVSSAQKEVFNISISEAIRRLRSKGEPIRLFGESDKERRLRLRALELIEERGEKVGQNDFMRALRGAESSIVNEELQGKKKDKMGGKEAKEMDKKKEEEEEETMREAGEGGRHREGVGMNSLLDLKLVEKDINKVYPIIYYTLKGLLRDWEQTLAERPSKWITAWQVS